MIILDLGSGETCKNNIGYVYKMIDAIPKTDKEIVIKWQLFTKVGDLLPLDHSVYVFAKEYAEGRGFKTAASVFDEPSLEFLLKTDPAFVKIACRPGKYYLADLVPIDTDLVISVGNPGDYEKIKVAFPRATILCCVADYPAEWVTYASRFKGLLHYGISDHTEDLYLWNKYQPLVWERHYCLDDSTGPDAASFAIRPDQLKEIL